MRRVGIRTVRDGAEIDLVRTLLREYAAFLASNPAAGDHVRIPGFQSELATLPGPYVQPGGLWLATADDEVGGCVALRPMPAAFKAKASDSDGTFALEMKRLWVGPRYRGLGLGRRLVHEVIVHARSHGASAIYLDTLSAAMPEACSLYLDLGFEPTEVYSDHPAEGLACFRKRL